MRAAWVLVLALWGCGIKAPPRPPLDEVSGPVAAPPPAPDGGCCREARP